MIEYYESQNFVGNIYLPSMIFFSTENPYSKLFICKTLLIVIPFSNFSQHILGQFSKKIFCLQLKEIENICEILLSESRNHTLEHGEILLS